MTMGFCLWLCRWGPAHKCLTGGGGSMESYPQSTLPATPSAMRASAQWKDVIYLLIYTEIMFLQVVT